MLPRLIVVDREEFLLSLFRWSVYKRRYRLVDAYTVTVGKLGAETPHGMYFVEAKSRTPDWRVPSSTDYPEASWGRVYKFGEAGNPFSGGFVSLKGRETGVGIHGTSFDPQVGTASSHGCIRMETQELLKIYDECKIGTPVYLH